jgi:hypothetical protein
LRPQTRWQRQRGGDGGGIGIKRLLDDRCEAELMVGGAGGGTNDEDNDDDGSLRWAEAQRAMYGRHRDGRRQGIAGHRQDGVPINVIVAATVATLRRASMMTTRTGPPWPRYDERAGRQQGRGRDQLCCCRRRCPAMTSKRDDDEDGTAVAYEIIYY